ncbi:MAG: arabinofuranosidase catalytic domain-containing protein [Aestuariivirga sp.]|uniref:arabinofuranosidase catalytic domain-containing protein n=1 Tax=Aestuariivirga sp. TaxID=2650926 RepID=UPI00301716C6
MARPHPRRLFWHAVPLLFSTVMCLLLFTAPAMAATLNFTLTASEPVVVTGTPRIAIDVGGATRYATYASGSGTAALSFSYAVQAGDFDANGITIAAPLELNGGTLTDVAGNPPTALTFTVPNTSAIKVQTYTAAFTTSPITEANANAVSFAIAKAPTGASFSYSITSSGGAGTVSGSGTIAGASHSVANVDVSALPSGMLTLSVTVSTAASGTGSTKTSTSTPTFTGVLDNLPAAALALSLRRLGGAYGGPLLRVRRSPDNAERDIAASIAGALDITTLTSFCGSSSCFVLALYDQSGNGRDAVQATAASQPRIMNAGTLDVEGGRPTLRYTAGGRVLVAPSIPQTIRGSTNAVVRSAASTGQMHIMGDRGGFDVTGNVGRIIRAVNGGASYLGANIAGAKVSLMGSTQQQRVVTVVSGTLGLSGALDGVETVGDATTVYIPSTHVFWIGGTGPGGGVGDWVGTISEVTLFNITLSTSERQTLERNQGAYYGIAVQ